MTKPFLLRAAVVLALVALPLGRSGSAQNALPTARSIVDRYVTAMGGEAAFAKVTSVHATGRVDIPQQGISGTAGAAGRRDCRHRTDRNRLRRQGRLEYRPAVRADAHHRRGTDGDGRDRLVRRAASGA
jgi:hypothetical protein